MEDRMKSGTGSGAGGGNRRRVNTDTGAGAAPMYIPPTSPVATTFSTADGFLYRYPSKSHTSEGVGSYTLFGAMITVAVNRWAKRDDMSGSGSGSGSNSKSQSNTNTNTNANTNSFGFAISDYGGVEKQLEANTEGQGYIHYELVVRHHNDEWALWKR